MPLWSRLALTAVIWCFAIVARFIVGEGNGAGVFSLALLVVASTSWLWGALPGLAAGIAIGAGEAGLFGSGASLDTLVGLARDGALAAPFILSVVGLSVGSVASLRRQVRFHRDASNRAQFDVLTGLLNRPTFEARLSQWMLGHPAGGQPTAAVLFVDLDRFKFVNDTFGHAIGDKLLRLIGRTLRDNVREGDLVARVGGDEFVIALCGLHDRDIAAVIAEKLVTLLSTPYEIDGRSVAVSASIGIAMYPRDGEDVATLTKSADYAMYAVKAGGKNSYNFSTQEMRSDQTRRLDLERALRVALHDNELELVY
jgi:diguanylate cyclase (GGDEF)-like protein